MKSNLYLLLICFSFSAHLLADEPVQTNLEKKEEKKYQSLIQKNKTKIDLALGASTGIGAMYSGSYIYQLIEQTGLKKSKYYIMASAGTIGAGLATIIFYGGGEKLRNKLYEFYNNKEPKNGDDWDFNSDQINYYYETAFILAYVGIIAGHVTSELLLTSN